ncbi:MAG: hypothetical protein J6386_20735 [Candidatus Synoicihabitans palmerolidicus]|nr:hypothetical protein [Candidatus Synoicihabitans palmerolidicus]
MKNLSEHTIKIAGEPFELKFLHSRGIRLPIAHFLDGPTRTMFQFEGQTFGWTEALKALLVSQPFETAEVFNFPVFITIDQGRRDLRTGDWMVLAEITVNAPSLVGA